MGEHVADPSELDPHELEVVVPDSLFDADAVLFFEEFDEEEHCVELERSHN